MNNDTALHPWMAYTLVRTIPGKRNIKNGGLCFLLSLTNPIIHVKILVLGKDVKPGRYCPGLLEDTFDLEFKRPGRKAPAGALFI